MRPEERKLAAVVNRIGFSGSPYGKLDADRPAYHMASQTCTVPLAIWQAGHDVPLAIWRVGRDHPARHMANRTWIVPLAIWRAGHGSSRLPYGKPDEDVVLSIFRRFLLWYFSEVICSLSILGVDFEIAVFDPNIPKLMELIAL